MMPAAVVTLPASITFKKSTQTYPATTKSVTSPASGSSDYEQRIRAYAYFANVNDPSAVTELVRVLGSPNSWRSRAVDELSALTMMKRQCDRRFIPYLRASLAGRYSSFAESAVRALVAGCK